MVTAGQGVSRIPKKDCPAKLDLAMYNARTLRTDEKLIELEEAVSKLHCTMIGLSAVRREVEDTIILKSSNLFYYQKGEQSQGGVGFMVQKSLVNNIVRVESVSSRVAYVKVKITKRYSLKVIQVYAHTTAHSDEEVEALYEDISKAIHASKTYYSFVMGDFNASLDKRSGAELRVGQFGYRQRNERGKIDHIQTLR
ncbi:jg3147 [Pararge aegeria aegeria]|uniref:Jg3147 protein n=1 Tax=Pararge aegeria aegeria TaxID=348720 RepID=A0A8S4QV35_9NEOP|nr:jg3147 [Pararge aegeria aegeria]